MLLAGDKVYVAHCNAVFARAVFLHERLHHVVPALALEIALALGKGSARQCKQQAQRY